MTRSASTHRGLSIRWLLTFANAFVLVTPLLAALGLRLYDTFLVRQTERQLIAQAVVVAETWRELWREESGVDVGDFRPPQRAHDSFVPVDPVLDLAFGIAPPPPMSQRVALQADTAARRAGQRITPLLLRAQVFNLSAVRVLDEMGCVVATTRGEQGLCLDELPEVQKALRGSYAAVARQRISDEPTPPLGDIRSRGSVRVFAALPVFVNGQVTGVVCVSRTSLDALTSLWNSRRGLVLVAAATVTLGLLISLVFAWIIAHPLRVLTQTATAIARGEPGSAFVFGRLAPREVHALAQAVDTMTTRLRQRADYVAELAANISHELKTPVTGIRGAAELLRESPHMSEAQRQRFLTNIEADAERLERLVTRLLQLARIEAADDSSESVEVRPFFDALASRFAPRVTLSLGAVPDTVTIKPDHLASAVTNLVDNALRHGGAKNVLLHIGSEGSRLRIAVTDYGPGISPANQAHVFDRFFTTERDRGGTGLGLSIVKAIAEHRGGKISFVTSQGETTFTLLL